MTDHQTLRTDSGGPPSYSPVPSQEPANGWLTGLPQPQSAPATFDGSAQPGTAAQTTCANGHPVDLAAAYCGMCGAAAHRADAPGPDYRVPVGSGMAPGIAPQEPRRPDTLQSPASPNVGMRDRGKRYLVLGSALLLLVAAFAAWMALRAAKEASPAQPPLQTASAPPSKGTVSGNFVLTDSDTADSDCVGSAGYSDIEPGATVILTNESGVILSGSALGSGTADTVLGTCTYSFSFPDVPLDQAQYGVEITHRGKVVHSNAEMKTSNWEFDVSLG